MSTNKNVEFLSLYEPIHGRFIKYCTSISYGVLDTEDLAQEAILATLLNYSKINDKNKLLNYMIGTVRNIIFNQKRRQKFSAKWDEKILEKLEDDAPNPEIALDIHFLLKAMDELPSLQKEAIILFEISGFSMKEISEIQHSSVAATKKRISRGRKILQKQLADDHSKSSLANRLSVFASILF